MAHLALIVDDVLVNKFELNEQPLTIGRSPDNSVQIEDHAVSGHHAQIVRQADEYFDNQVHFFIEDLKSTNSTRVNGEKISRQRLFHNDLVEVGYNKFRFIDDTQVNLERTAVILPGDH